MMSELKKAAGFSLISFVKSAAQSLAPSTMKDAPTPEELIELKMMRIERKANEVLLPEMKQLYEEYSRDGRPKSTRVRTDEIS